MKFVIDPADDPRYPMRYVREVWPMGENLLVKDGEPYCQEIVLTCGHGAGNTYGNKDRALVVGEGFRCRKCFVKFLEGRMEQ
jgi:hypothetical protein